MKIRRVTRFALVVAFLAAGIPLFAHHGNAAYDMTKEIVLKQATVTKVFWANPHVLLQFDMKDDKGDVEHWAGETGSPNALYLAGWTRNSVTPGDMITVYLYKAKVVSAKVGILTKIVLADGSALYGPFGRQQVDGEFVAPSKK
jgi:hypothetical protein